MNKKIINFLALILIFSFIILLFKDNNILVTSVNKSLSLFLSKVFPFLFIMITLNNLLIDLNFPYFINKIFKNTFIYIFIMAILSGSPVNAVIIKQLLEKKVINNKDASIYLAFTCFNNPLFLYVTFLRLFPKENIIWLFIFIYLSNLLIYFIFRKKLTVNVVMFEMQKTSLAKSLTKAIKNALTSNLNILAIIIFFNIITDIFFLNSNSTSTCLFKGLIEITSGLTCLENVLINIKIKKILALIIISFSGLAIHMQINTILEDYQIDYKYFYLARLILIILSLFSFFL